MAKKINFLIILGNLAFIVLGLFFLYNNFLFYKQSKKTNAVITSIGRPDNCLTVKSCYWSRKVSLSFSDSNNVVIKDSQELSTVTLVAQIVTVGNEIRILYKPRLYTISIYDHLVPNLGPASYEVKIYGWLYWVYPILTILLGPLLYFFGKKILANKGALKA